MRTPLILWAFLSLLLPLNTLAQKMQLSAAVDEPGYDHMKVIGQDDNGYFVLLSNLNLENPRNRVGLKSRKTKALYFDLDLKLKWTKQVENFPESSELESIGFFDGKIFIVSSVEKKGENTFDFYIKSIDAAGNETPKKEPIVSFRSEGENEKVTLLASRMKTKLGLVMHTNVHIIKTATQEDHIAVFDDQFKLLEKKIFTIPYSEKYYSAVQYALSENGDVVALGMKSDKPKNRGDLNYEARISVANDTVVKSIEIGTGRNIKGLGTSFDDINNKVVFAGFNEMAGPGIIYASIGLQPDDAIRLFAKPINPSKNKQLAGKRYARSGMSIANFPVDHIILRNNGGAVLVTELAYTSEYSYYDYFMQTYNNRVEYHYDDIVVLSIDNTGETEWSTVIEKEQISMDDGGYFSSYCSLLNSEQFAVFYNEDISRSNTVTTVTIDKTGAPVKQEVTKKDDKVMLVPRSGKQVGISEVLIPAYTRKTLVIAKITLE